MKEMFFNWLSGLGVDVTPMMALVIALGFIVLTAMVLHLVLHRILLVRLGGLLGKTKQMWLPPQLQQRLFYRLAFVFQGAVLLGQAEIWLPKASESLALIELLAQLWILLFLLLALFALLDCLLSLSRHTRLGRDLPLRGIFQGVKLVASILVGILMIALLLGKSPLFLFSGLGAMTAVLMLVFKDPILGLVAGIQLSANRMLSVGDWLQMDKYGADGEVTDIGLTTVKVSNWDKTITTIPTYALISDSFKNWQGMTESGGRRIKRSVNIDMTSVRFLTSQEQLQLKQARLLAPYLSRKEQELSSYNQQLSDAISCPINGRHLTNLGTLRAYLDAYLRAHAGIRKDMTLMVRQLAPTTDGLPLEIYCFTATTAWAEYEGIQADIFDHIFAIIEQFHLRLHQSPTGYDMHSWKNG
ncbi:mechanosensitive ion channel [Aeromonas caviae]|uniref:mechanosensitive ion channel family protein n=1 Tax=Aeromonas TaxID=642 RepID=UPI001495CBC6|nr:MULTISPECIES: mechanosensitive ion channel domain-containing protein [Aeromonas]MBA8783714.1 mechanosensitive ion channel [Aeromonas caviae]MBA8787768.1 mechanosensitive ion channel [Aeromonas sp. TW 6]MCJ7931995.1 mechanosensitive ion channel family protein [Aeromonas sp. LsrichE-8G]MDY7842907.1 mechanosensitive ion channel [Aeromonas caviae]WAF59437.1 mechanosensitive ion channel family protein [Aeromonas caviae]